MDNTLSWDVSNTIALAAVAVAFLSLILSLLHRRQIQHRLILETLQGKKESVAYIAFEVGKKKIPKAKKRRKEIIEALCLAVVYQESGRSRVLIYSALKEIYKVHKEELEDAIETIERRFNEFRRVTDLSKADKHLNELNSVLDQFKKK